MQVAVAGTNAFYHLHLVQNLCYFLETGLTLQSWINAPEFSALMTVMDTSRAALEDNLEDSANAEYSCTLPESCWVATQISILH